MRAAQTFQKKPTDHTRAIMKLGNPTDHTGETQSAAPTGAKRVHVHSLDVEVTVFQTF